MQGKRGAREMMRASILAPAGAFVLPVATPYEWQLFCEHVAVAVRHRGTVHLRIGAVRCEARSRAADGAHRRCEDCARRLTGMTFRVAWRELCLGCAQQCLASEPIGNAHAAAV
jgi:hypothetical protein